MYPILIAGGGIGGLATAIALAQRGIAAHVLERQCKVSQAGAGIQIGPNGVRVLHQLGVADILRPLVGSPNQINVYSGVSGRRLARFPLGNWILQRHGAPYWTAHRHDLHAALLAVANSYSLIRITNEFSVETVQDVDMPVNKGGDIERPPLKVVSDQGQIVAGQALIGADGLWSTIRLRLFEAPLPRFAGHVAARAVIPAADVGELFANGQTGLWLAPKSHVVHYPINAGDKVAVVVILDITDGHGIGGDVDIGCHAGGTAPAKPSTSWASLVDRDALVAHFRTAPPLLKQFLTYQIKAWQHWALYEPPSLPGWSQDRVVLMGDAAHPILPYFAQGAAMALEDAVTLAALLAATPSDPPTAFTSFEVNRRQRLVRVGEASRQNGTIYHQSPPLSLARDMTLRLLPGALMMRRYDWLYGWQAPD